MKKAKLHEMKSGEVIATMRSPLGGIITMRGYAENLSDAKEKVSKMLMHENIIHAVFRNNFGSTILE